MGFFSSIKSLWGGKKNASDPGSLDSPESTVPLLAESTDPAATSAVNAASDAAPDSAPAATPEAASAAVSTSTAAETAPGADWEAQLAIALRAAEPRPSVWLSIVLDGAGQKVEVANELLWQRIRFLLQALSAPEEEITRFIADFQDWLARMEYRYLDDFRSELQYRIALALDLEDENDEHNRVLLKLNQGLRRTREQLGTQLTTLFSSGSSLDKAFWDELEEILLMADVGYETSTQLIANLKKQADQQKLHESAQIRELFRKEVEALFVPSPRIQAVNPPEVVLMVGVNGVGKTTTIAKLAYRARLQGRSVLIAAADTFRAAAAEQLEIWAQRVGAGFYSKKAGSDPAAVAYEAMDYALANGYDLVFVDTAGRLQNKSNLMDELHKIRAVISKKHPAAPHRTVLVIDATTGQNALSQTKVFKESSGVNEIILTKLDGTAKGGIALAVASQFKLPITYVGLGEKMEDLRPFNSTDFANALLGDTVSEDSPHA